MGDTVRYDVGELRRPERTSQGFLRADAALTRSGIFRYRNADGTERLEYRPPEEVFREDSLASFEDAPVTLGHPARLLDADSAKTHTRGWLKDKPRRDGDWLVGRLTLTDKEAIAKAEAGAQISLGYRIDYDPTPGMTPQGHRYDGIQKNIRGNHVAILDRGRAFDGTASAFRLDAADAVMVPEHKPGGDKPPHQEKTMSAKVRIDGVDYEATEQLTQVIAAQQEKHKTRVDELEAAAKTAKDELAKATARADQAEADAKKAKQEREDALKPEAVQKRVNERTALVAKAQEVLSAETKFDSMTDAQIKRAVIEKLHPDAKARLDSGDASYLEARYDAAIESWDKRPNKKVGEMRRDAGDAGGERLDAAARMKKVQDKQANAWKGEDDSE